MNARRWPGSSRSEDSSQWGCSKRRCRIAVLATCESWSMEIVGMAEKAAMVGRRFVVGLEDMRWTRLAPSSPIGRDSNISRKSRYFGVGEVGVDGHEGKSQRQIEKSMVAAYKASQTGSKILPYLAKSLVLSTGLYPLILSTCSISVCT